MVSWETSGSLTAFNHFGYDLYYADIINVKRFVVYRIIYASTATEAVSFDLISGIVKKASEANKELNVTGGLVFNSNYFMQVLEGSQKNVNSLYHKIARDDRHNDLVIISYEQISERLFPNWGMRLATITKENADVYFRYCAESAFDPYQFTSKGALNIVLKLTSMSNESPIG